MYIRIYQVKEGEPCAFRPLSEVKKADPAVYMQVWDGRVEAKDLEKVFTIFNIAHPEGYKGRSMSVSDIVGIMDDGTGEWTYYFVDTIGFTVVPFEPAATDNPINENPQHLPCSFPEQNAQRIFDSYNFEPITLFRDKNIYGFYTNDRVYEQLPEGLSKYEFRHGDTEYFSSIEKTVKVNYSGAFITNMAIDIPDTGYISLSEEDTPNFAIDCDIPDIHSFEDMLEWLKARQGK